MAIILTRDGLYTSIWLTPIGQLAGRLGMTPARLREICLMLAVPLPPLGYWNAQKAGNNPAVTPLPPHDGPDEVRIGSEKRAKLTKPSAPVATPRSTVQPRYITLQEWAVTMFSRVPHNNTLLRWVHDGRIQPQARKIARIWWVTPDAEYIAD